MKYLLFTMPTCSDCHMIKEFLEEKGVEFEEVDAATDEGIEVAAKFNVMSTPVFISLEDDKEVGRADDMEGVKKIIENQSL